jgi:hypothetical protein
LDTASARLPRRIAAPTAHRIPFFCSSPAVKRTRSSSIPPSGLRSADPADRVIVSVRLTLDLTTFALSI